MRLQLRGESLAKLDHPEDDRLWSSYDFEEQWKDLSFNERWSMFSTHTSVEKLQSSYDPALDCGPVCHPTLVGSEDSGKLAILMHGFLSCPGMWFRVVPRLLAAGFRVMLPVLPGHGRAPIEVAPNKFKDVLSEMPTSSHEYVAFASALGHLVRQFKKEHPSGVVVAAGHSLGGAVTSMYAMENPDVVDRVLLLNPMFGLNFGFIDNVANWLPDTVLSKGASCEKQRDRSSGGICQFALKHVSAMVDFAYVVLCCRWGMTSACTNPPRSSNSSEYTNFKKTGRFTDERDSLCSFYGVSGDGRDVATHRELFGHMKFFQVVTSRGDKSVSNDMIRRFVEEVRKQRLNEEFNFCMWPKSLGHSYMSNRPAPEKSDKWWHPYVERTAADFLTLGKRVDIVSVKGNLKMCLERDEDVQGEFLARLPAVQRRRGYWLAGFPKARILFSNVATESANYDHGDRGNEEMELISLDIFGLALIIVTRPHHDANIERILYVNPESCKLPKKDEKNCAFLQYRSFPADVALVPDFSFTSGKRISNYFCGRGFASKIGEYLKCMFSSSNINAAQQRLDELGLTLPQNDSIKQDLDALFGLL
eukprot:CAMPEP_0169267006 /NCGR_PEP_ID=MMETSP1016-20121227/46809_1 /TAXON_ID=342587 /ORGANISM="Karlodinium micrum, Strain CCMP2283" /LENGTH=589 /DNA_ID=CAMNT_0009351167 /DNA_START=82 /DNA_END=1851 /DNA_ORIENTATION=-